MDQSGGLLERHEYRLGIQDFPTPKIQTNHLKTNGNSKRTVQNEWLATTYSSSISRNGGKNATHIAKGKPNTSLDRHAPHVSKTHLCTKKGPWIKMELKFPFLGDPVLVNTEVAHTAHSVWWCCVYKPALPGVDKYSTYHYVQTRHLVMTTINYTFCSFRAGVGNAWPLG